jgi:hypothetical protein
MLGDGVINPIRGHDAQCEEKLEHRSELATDILGGHLGTVHGNDYGGHTHADTADDAGDVEGGQRVGVDYLDNGTDVEDEGRQREGPSSAVFRGEGPDKEAREEC